MPSGFRVSYRIDETKNRLLVTVRGAYEGAALIDTLIALYQQIDQPWSYDRVMDMRAADGFTTLPDLMRAAQALAEMAGTPPPPRKRLALISQDPLDKPRLAGIGDIFPKDYIQTFESLDEALTWLDTNPPEPA
ncbi:hypothetical protein [Asticcacaulis machinosus]|uniref:STAS/SEC14 domain-containing protein n=1 Tax=Asticcacaulis machinosus TaxID=2984211 RepID=A0ABT5HF07_9CAUL|nr:hypothetical protein [Asticcacaulis machinosus]MDC7674666.1 hypothetical protein [Asticcacaulis machinosus]